MLLLADLAVRRRIASSLYVWDTSEVLHLEHKDEPHEGIDVKDDHATARHCLDAYDYIESSSAAPARLVVIP